MPLYPTYKRLIAVLCVSVVLGGAAGYWYMKQPTSRDLTGSSQVTITLTKQGFVPETIYINPGTTVTFVTELDTNFWPASDLHPFHSIYPDFDPKQPVPPDESWSFTFESVGRWHYHDHIGLETGSVIVVPEGETDLRRYDRMLVCDQAQRGKRTSCEKEQIAYILKTEGVDAAFDEVASIYDASPAFRNECHSFAHDLGLMTFQTYGEDPDFPSSTMYCGQGFYHGYMEGFLQDHSGDVASAAIFCRAVGEQLGGDHPLAGPQCIHGAGHGIMEYLLRDRPDMADRLDELIDTGVESCDAFNTDDERFRCASGVYAVAKDWINIQGLQEQYAHLFTLYDPVTLCRTLEKDWAKHACAWEMGKQVVYLAAQDSDLALRSVLNAPDWDNGQWLPATIESAGFLLGELNVTLDASALFGKCGVINDDALHLSCVRGLINGLIFNAMPGKEPEHIAPYCLWDGISTEEKSECARILIVNMEGAYGSEAKARACMLFTELPESREFCN